MGRCFWDGPWTSVCMSLSGRRRPPVTFPGRPALVVRCTMKTWVGHLMDLVLTLCVAYIVHSSCISSFKIQGWENYINFVIHDFVGINFDFNKLQAAEGHYYNVTNGDYDYILNLCGPVKNTLCDQKASPVTNPGVCQVKHGGTAA